MIVLKFGGTSVANAERIEHLVNVIKPRLNGHRLCIVVSAFGGVTNQLERLGKSAISGDEDYTEILEGIKSRHIETIRELGLMEDKNTPIIPFIDMVMSELESICKGVSLIKELTPKTRARLMAAGELLSSRVIYSYFESIRLKVKLIDSRDCIVTDDQYLNANVDYEQTATNLEKVFSGEFEVFVAPGFISRSKSGDTTTLGRGGSDFTAAIFASMLEAERLEIWTDVNGMMSADPRYVDKAFTIPKLSYEEALELSYFGAKVIYPPTVQPVLKKGIPIYIKNTFEPDHPGSEIRSEVVTGAGIVQGFSNIPGIALITITGSGMVGVPGIARRFFKALSEVNVNVLFITQSSSEHSITIALNQNDKDSAVTAIEKEFQWELLNDSILPPSVETDMTIIAAVGDGMRERVGVAGRLFSLLGENGISVRAIAQGSTERNISFVIPEVDAIKALNVLHEGFFLSKEKVIHLFVIGVGNVGSAMMEQLQQQQSQWKEDFHLDIKLAGIANSRKMVFNGDGIEVGEWKSLLEVSQYDFDPAGFVDKMKELNLRNSVFVDITASERISDLYKSVLEESISVVTANKIAAASRYDHYSHLKRLALEKNVKFLFETNVAAGLPVIKTIKDLVLTGDKINKIEAVLSGSLNYIFNSIQEGKQFSEAVLEAREKGYTEPDPTIDLSGIDVARKILILARESGAVLEMDDVNNESFLPGPLMQISDWDKLYAELKEVDGKMNEWKGEAAEKGTKLRYLARYENGKASVGVTEIPKESAAYKLGGTDNIILLYTERYPNQPMMVQGAGAGPHVTASGVIADILRIANF